ncbi:MAG: hypothetical protein ABIQ70_14615 [Dokdonella sp.]
MRTPDASGLLDTWERGFNLPPPQRSLALLALAHPHAQRSELTALSLGQRDALLLRLRERLFGARLDFVASCPACAGVVESTLEMPELQLDMPPPPSLQILQVDERCITFRVPTLGDLIGLPGNPLDARLTLVSRCLSNPSSSAETAQTTDTLSAQAIDAIGVAMSAADPSATADLALACPACGERWLVGLDIATFLWHEIDAWARRTLRDVHALARAYAWSERDVLALSPTRRQMYLELCRT